MEAITIAIGADHRGFAMKAFLQQEQLLPGVAITWIDVGAYSNERSDYPFFAVPVVRALLEQRAQYGILLCGSGIGMAIVANRFCGIYAGLAWNEEIARQAKEDDNVNVLVLPSDYIDNKKARAILCAWLGSEFKHGRYERRIALIDTLTP